MNTNLLNTTLIAALVILSATTGYNCRQHNNLVVATHNDFTVEQARVNATFARLDDRVENMMTNLITLGAQRAQFEDINKGHAMNSMRFESLLNEVNLIKAYIASKESAK